MPLELFLFLLLLLLLTYFSRIILLTKCLSLHIYCCVISRARTIFVVVVAVAGVALMF
ncbi:hypothetical protein T492DRAFT_1095098 [Pavlovales sp. CCMP2436]|nr:hypothetical protein T492DRAFT_1095098 [Pavlovales sp. CCMP2436]